MKGWIKKHPRETSIGSIVLLGHLFFLFYHYNPTHSPPSPKKSIIVHTHVPIKPHVKKKAPTLVKQKEPKKVVGQIGKTLAKVEKKESVAKPEPALLLPPKIEELQIDQPTENPSYLSLLVQSLHEKLQLPEEGKVRLELTILQSGRVEKLQVLYTESENNKRYLERELIHLFLPPFSDELAGKLQHTFILNFCHEQ